MGMNDDTLDIAQVLVLVESALHEARHLTQVGDTGLGVMVEHGVGKDGIGDLRSCSAGSPGATGSVDGPAPACRP